MFKLLPVFKDVKAEVMQDVARPTSLSWHHTIGQDSREVAATAFFFDRMLTSIAANRYLSYEQAKSYASASHMEARLTDHDEYAALVYDPTILSSLPDMFEDIRNTIRAPFFQEFPHVWPMPSPPVSPASQPMDSDADSDAVERQRESEAKDVWSGGADLAGCKVGWFALCRILGGLRLIKITEKLPMQEVDGFNAIPFLGREYVCTVPNTQMDCLYGTWHFHPGPNSASIELLHWEVCVYFEALESSKLPDGVVDQMGEIIKITNLFED